MRERTVPCKGFGFDSNGTQIVFLRGTGPAGGNFRCKFVGFRIMTEEKNEGNQRGLLDNRDHTKREDQKCI